MARAPLTSVEKKLLTAALVVAALVGASAAYAAYLDEAEAQFHGGVLKEDRAEAEFALVREPACAFAQWAAGIGLVLGVLPIGVRRFGRGRRDARVKLR